MLVDAGKEAGDSAPDAFWRSLRAAVAEMQIAHDDDPAHGAAARAVLRRSDDSR